MAEVMSSSEDSVERGISGGFCASYKRYQRRGNLEIRVQEKTIL